MQQLTSSVYAETGIRGCNHGFVVTSDGVVMIDSPQKPSDAVKLKAIIERHGPLRWIINTEPHGDHWTGNAYFDAPVVAHEGVRTRMLDTNMAEHVKRVATFGPDEPALLDGYQANAPVVTFREGMTLHVGNHTFRMVGMPGHTPYQAAVVVEDEGVVFTSDNIFCKCQTWIQEGDPDRWYESLDALRALPQDVFVPGHGPVTGKDYLDEQKSFIQEWVEYVRAAANRGLAKEEAAASLTAMVDRYPMDVGQDGMAPMVSRLNVANLYDYVTGEGIHQR